MPPMSPMPAETRADPRSHLVRALEADLIGPFTLEPAATETLALAPTRWYLTGFLAPEHAPPPVEEPVDDGDVLAGDDEDEQDGSGPEGVAKGPRTLPSSIGLSVLLPPAVRGGATDSVAVRLDYADYVGTAEEPAPDAKRREASKNLRWTRVPRSATAELSLDAAKLAEGHAIAPGLFVVGHLGTATAHGLLPGTRALSLFVVNKRPVGERFDESCVFQVRLEVRHAAGLVARPNRRDEGSDEEDEQVADLQFRARCEWAVGHGVSVQPMREGERIVGAETVWLPSAQVPRVETREIPSVTTSMDALAEPMTGAALRARLAPLVEEYATWIADKRALPLGRRRLGFDGQPRQDARHAALACGRGQGAYRARD